jgi:nitroimidazol reductase NimA-like FMN-containing flavoprotein (pyridoxamine 5'-phosphate oxidase superfamily)
MEVHELTEEEREQMVEEVFRKMNRERKHLSKEEMETEIASYLSKRQVCSLATCGKEGVPRVSVVNYANEGLTLYIFSEGGDKFKNLGENNSVGVGVGDHYKTFDAMRGVNIWGTAEVFTEETKEFAYGMKFFAPLMKDLEEETGLHMEFPKGMLRIIRITPTKMVYHYNRKGIANAHWEAT